MSRIGIIYTHHYLEHDTGSHLENGGRVTAIREALLEASWSDRLKWMEPRMATLDQVAMIHDRDYIHFIQRACEDTRGISYLNPDTAISPESYAAALFSAGGVLDGIDGLMSGEIEGFYSLGRPPGHHAEFDESLGFCLFNNIAIGARYAQEEHGLERVFILDWDVHHGNGTQHSFEDDPSVFFVSFHQYPHYPGTGGRKEMGEGPGLGYTLNLPMRAGSGNDDYMLLMEECVIPAMRKFDPQLVLISAGFDAHRHDMLGSIMLNEEGYSAILQAVLDSLRGDTRVGMVLEGGYNYASLSDSSVAVTGVLCEAEPVAYFSEAKSPGSYAVELAGFMKGKHLMLKTT